MKKLYVLIFILLNMNYNVLAEEVAIMHNRQDLLISDTIIQFDNYDNILLPNGLSIPFETIYIPLTDFTPNATISTNSIESEQISFYPDLFSTDIVTSSDKNLYKDVISAVSFDQLGFQQLHVVEQLSISNIDYLKCMLFPVTFDSTGNLFFHTISKIKIGNKNVTSTQLHTKSQIKEIQSNKTETLSRSLATTTEYVIITNQNLSESFSQLVKYKNETGITTELKLIEDILPQYTGRDDAEKMREYLKEFYASGGSYVLLGGDETVLPIRYTYHNIAYAPIDLENQQVCDLYFADLTGNWNADNDSVWGEKYTDSADLTPELYVGRLPFNDPSEVSQYIDKLIQYETNNKEIDLSYLEKSFFFCSDQMRDYGAGGQHKLIAEALPDYFIVDTTNGVEYSAGNDINPTNPTSKELEPILSSGFGLVNIIAHGSSMTFEVRTSKYNEWPKSYFTTDANLTSSGIVSSLEKNDKVSLYISLGCDNGAYDKDQPPFNHLSPNMVQTLLAQPKSGAVGFVANTRWGWVGSSHLLQKRFLEYLFANQNQPAIVSLYQMKEDYYYYRDLIYGISYFGDPTMIVYTKKPEKLVVDIQKQQNQILVTAYSDIQILENTKIFVSQESNVIAEYLTDDNGEVIIDYDFELGATYKITTIKDGYTISQKNYTPSIATGVDDESNLTLPTYFALEQNYPNPFNPRTQIQLSLPTKTNLNLQVYNMLGQVVTTITDETYNAGVHLFEWDGNNNSGQAVSTGVYFYRMETSEFVQMKKMVLLK